MKWLNHYRMRLVFVAIVATIVIGGGTVKADFVFGEAVKMDSPISTVSYAEIAPHVSSDGLSLYFGSGRPGGFGRGDIWVATRPSVRDSWGEPTNLGPIVNTEYGDNQPEISADGLSLYFESDRPGGQGNKDIWVTTRRTKK